MATDRTFSVDVELQLSDKISAKLTKLIKLFNKIDKQVKATTKVFTHLNKAATAAGRNVNKAFDKGLDVGPVQRDARATVRIFNKLSDHSKKTSSLISRYFKAISIASVFKLGVDSMMRGMKAIGRGIKNFVAGSMKEAIGLESAISGIMSASNVSFDNKGVFKEFRTNIKDINKESQFSNEQIAQSMQTLITLGFEPLSKATGQMNKDFRGLTEASLKLATASGGKLDIVKSAETLGQTLKAFGPLLGKYKTETEKYNHVVDVFSKANTLSAAAVEDFHKVAGKLGGVAQKTGQGFHGMIASYMGVRNVTSTMKDSVNTIKMFNDQLAKMSTISTPDQDLLSGLIGRKQGANVEKLRGITSEIEKLQKLRGGLKGKGNFIQKGLINDEIKALQKKKKVIKDTNKSQLSVLFAQKKAAGGAATSKQIAEVKKLGVNFRDAEGNVKSLNIVLFELDKAFKKHSYTKIQKDTALIKMFGAGGQQFYSKVAKQRQTVEKKELVRMRDKLEALGKETKMYDKLIEANRNNARVTIEGTQLLKYFEDQIKASEGTGTLFAQNYLKTFSGQLELVKSTWSNIKESFGRGLITAIFPLMEKIRAWLNSLNAGAIEKFGAKVGAVFVWVADLGRGVYKVLTDFYNILKDIGVFKAFGEAWKIIAKQFATAGKKGTIMTDILTGIAQVLKAVAKAVGPVIEVFKVLSEVLSALAKTVMAISGISNLVASLNSQVTAKLEAKTDVTRSISPLGGFAMGATVVPGTAYMGDSIPAMVQPGEAIIPERRVNAQTIPILEAIRTGQDIPSTHHEETSTKNININVQGQAVNPGNVDMSAIQGYIRRALRGA